MEHLGSNLVTLLAPARDLASGLLAYLVDGVDWRAHAHGGWCFLDLLEAAGHLLRALGLCLEDAGHVLRLVALAGEQLDHLANELDQAHLAALERHLTGALGRWEAGGWKRASTGSWEACACRLELELVSLFQNGYGCSGS